MGSKVELFDSMGSDEKISQVAGISHDSEEGPGVEKLLKWRHMVPFEFGQIVLRVRCPIMVARHILRHRAASVVERSGRYCDLGDEEAWQPEVDEKVRHAYKKCYELGKKTYKALIEVGVPKEKARAVLPVGLYTEFFFRIDVRHMREFASLRLAKDAQAETREVAGMMVETVRKIFPKSMAGV